MLVLGTCRGVDDESVISSALPSYTHTLTSTHQTHSRWVLDTCRGVDDEPVTPKDKPKSINRCGGAPAASSLCWHCPAAQKPLVGCLWPLKAACILIAGAQGRPDFTRRPRGCKSLEPASDAAKNEGHRTQPSAIRPSQPALASPPQLQVVGAVGGAVTNPLPPSEHAHPPSQLQVV